MKAAFREYRVVVSKDPDTQQVVASVPALAIADFGFDTEAALRRLLRMIRFHLESLAAEGKPLPRETPSKEGVYLRVKLPANAA